MLWIESLPVPNAVAPLVAEIEKRADAGQKLAELALITRDKISSSDRVFLAMRARLLAPDDMSVWRLTENLLNGVLPAWHWSMLRDQPRNQAYADAIAANIRAGQTVLEIGAGTGILSIMAARAGADHVWAVERNKVLAEIARQNIAQNELSDRITVLQADAMDITVGGALPHRCDCLIHELVSDDLLAENVLPIVAHARAHLLTDDPVLLPESVAVWGRLVSDFPAAEQDVGKPHGVDLEAMNLLRHVTRSAVCDLSASAGLSEAQILAQFNLNMDHGPSDDQIIGLECTASGRMIGLEQWIGFSFPKGIKYDNAAGATSHWAHRLHQTVARDVSVGEQVHLGMKRLENLLILEPDASVVDQ